MGHSENILLHPSPTENYPSLRIITSIGIRSMSSRLESLCFLERAIFTITKQHGS
jgi:hypothetical protein